MNPTANLRRRIPLRDPAPPPPSSAGLTSLGIVTFLIGTWLATKLATIFFP